MFFTEEQARMKWCPIRWRSIMSDADITKAFKGDLAKCNASDCMMWEETAVFDEELGQKRGWCGLKQ